MRCDEIIMILNRAIFLEGKRKLIKSIANNPERFTGLLRPTKPYAKIIQFLLQLHEIKFGNALQEVIRYAIEQLGYRVEMENRYMLNRGFLRIDMIISKGDRKILVEMKVRYDHDSTKKRGQISNFEKKIKAFKEHNPETEVESVLYFVDSKIRKNEAFYREELERISNSYEIEAYLLYGKELFGYLGHGDVWDRIEEFIKKWKTTIPDLPDVDYDSDINDTVKILIKSLSSKDWYKLIEKDELWEEGGLISRLFKTGESLKVICQIFGVYNLRIAEVLKMRLEQLYKMEIENESN